MTPAEAKTRSIFRSIVRRYRVIFNILPKRLPASLNGHRIGFEIELWGTHAHPGESGKSECYECSEVVKQLEGIAEFISPTSCAYRTSAAEPVGARMHQSPRNGVGRNVKVGFDVMCRGGHEAVSTQCDGRCLVGMKEKLLDLGAAGSERAASTSMTTLRACPPINHLAKPARHPRETWFDRVP